MIIFYFKVLVIISYLFDALASSKFTAYKFISEDSSTLSFTLSSGTYVIFLCTINSNRPSHSAIYFLGGHNVIGSALEKLAGANYTATASNNTYTFTIGTNWILGLVISIL